MSEIQEIKNKLNAEIIFAQQQLVQNIEAFDFTQSMENQVYDSISDVTSSLVSDPSTLIPKLDTLSRYLLNEDNVIRSILKYTQLVLKAKQILSK